MRALIQGIVRLQQSQLSVQALTRLCNVYIFVLASSTDTEHLALVALQGALLAIPYTLLEALVGRALAADVVPASWNIERWASRAAGSLVLPVGVIGYLSASVALPDTSQAGRLLMMTPVLLQLPLEGLFWATARTRPRQRANLLPQLTAIGTILSGSAFATFNVRMDTAALPAQVVVLGWALLWRPPAGPELSPPSVWQSVRIGSVYFFAAVIDLIYSVALPSVAGALAGQTAVVVLRAMDLAFGPFHVALAATTREDIVGGKRSRLITGTRALTIASLLVMSVVVLGSVRFREFLAAELATLSTGVIALYCLYKAFLMVSTWLATRHMIRVSPRQYLISAIGSRVVALAASPYRSCGSPGSLACSCSFWSARSPSCVGSRTGGALLFQPCRHVRREPSRQEPYRLRLSASTVQLIQAPHQVGVAAGIGRVDEKAGPPSTTVSEAGGCPRHAIQVDDDAGRAHGDAKADRLRDRLRSPHHPHPPPGGRPPTRDERHPHPGTTNPNTSSQPVSHRTRASRSDPVPTHRTFGSPKNPQQRGFKPQRKRWAVERTFGLADAASAVGQGLRNQPAAVPGR